MQQFGIKITYTKKEVKIIVVMTKVVTIVVVWCIVSPGCSLVCDKEIEERSNVFLMVRIREGPCNGWLHRQCMELSRTSFKVVVNSSKLDSCPNCTIFSCPNCTIFRQAELIVAWQESMQILPRT